MSCHEPLHCLYATIHFNGQVKRCNISRSQKNILIGRDCRFQQTNKAEQVSQDTEVFIGSINQLTVKKVRHLSCWIPNVI